MKKTAFLSIASLLLAANVEASTCPFDGGASDAVNDGVVLTRYALGITGAPLTASTRYASLDPLQVQGNIECVGCALDMNGDGQIDTVDTTIIARHLVGFTGASLTAGLALGAGTRNSTTAVTGFLANGCAVGGAINAFVQGGNSFGAPAVLGTNDTQPLTVRSGGTSASLLVGTSRGGIRLSDAPLGVDTVGGVANNASYGSGGSTVFGGGWGTSCYDHPSGTATALCANVVAGVFATVGGGRANRAGVSPAIEYATVAGGSDNAAGGNGAAVSGGTFNFARDDYSVVSGGSENSALGRNSVVPGGRQNYAGAAGAFAAGERAYVRSPADAGTANGDSNTFVWSDGQGAAAFTSTGPNQFNVKADGGVRLHNGTSQFFGTQTRQMLNLWGAEFAIGVQANTLYQRSASNYSWFIGGVHCDTQNCPGAGGLEHMRLTPTSLVVNGVVLQSSDRALKENITRVDPKTMLAKLAALPVSVWNYRRDADKVRHVGPMAQDFKRLFGVGQDDKSIAAVDSQGVALAAIQGLHTLLKEKDAEIAVLRRKMRDVDQLRQRVARVEAVEAELSAIKRKLGM